MIAKDVNKNVIDEIDREIYKDVLLKKKCVRQKMNRNQSKNHKVRNYEINKVSLLSQYNKGVLILYKGFGVLVTGSQN